MRVRPLAPPFCQLVGHAPPEPITPGVIPRKMLLRMAFVRAPSSSMPSAVPLLKRYSNRGRSAPATCRSPPSPQKAAGVARKKVPPRAATIAGHEAVARLCRRKKTPLAKSTTRLGRRVTPLARKAASEAPSSAAAAVFGPPPSGKVRLRTWFGAAPVIVAPTAPVETVPIESWFGGPLGPGGPGTTISMTNGSSPSGTMMIGPSASEITSLSQDMVASISHRRDRRRL
ncbi:hypothetical protein CHELA1G11_13147 [Hyphomicrobiales bacterium]|nr:hypothetical protein CHELA1G11_13147 [Hyphomicrobiales bacterium]